jgi:hypothetical protein|eukprot:scaffold67_cov192-Alexandrium_tamarense.AAC.19
MKLLQLTTASSTLLAATSGVEAFLSNNNAPPSGNQLTKLQAKASLPEFERLRAKRLSLRQNVAEKPAVVSKTSYEFDADPFGDDLEYLFNANEVRDADAPFHILLLPS